MKIKLIWWPDKRGKFTVQSCYLEANQHHFNVQAGSTWQKIWRMKLHEHLKVHLWRSLADVLPTRSTINRKFHISEIYCPLCGAEEETTFHLFKECHFTRRIAFGSHWGYRLDNLPSDDLDQWINMCVDPKESELGVLTNKKWFSVFLSCLMYTVLKVEMRNCIREALTFLRPSKALRLQ